MVREHIGKISTRKEDSHKGDYGRIFIVAGSPGMTGAATLASLGALRTGSGLVTCGVPKSLNSIMEIKLTEVMTLPLAETKDGLLGLKAKKSVLDFAAKCNAVAIGPGLGSGEETRKLVKDLLKKIECPVVLDADGLNALEGKTALIKKRKQVTVITPHPGEMSRLIKKDVAFIQKQRVEVAKKAAKDLGVIVCLKGHRTVVANPEGQVYVNDTGNSGMATGGTGDVLTGMIASFVGQGVEAYSAAVSAVYLHGLAGDVAAERKGAFSMIASDLLDTLPEAFDKAGI
ncbi:NAD(P)H-hydrate dehydratase [Candidatus Omnitrophota bacterium]